MSHLGLRFQRQSIRLGAQYGFVRPQQLQQRALLSFSTTTGYTFQSRETAATTTTQTSSLLFFNKDRYINNNNNWIVGQSSGFHSSALCCSSDEDSTSGAAKDGLLDILERERAEEEMNASSQMPEDLVELKKLISKDWKIVEDPDDGVIRLVRSSATSTTTTGLKVQVSFHCQDVVEDEPSYDEEDPEEEEDREEPSMPNRFTVIVSKAGQTMLFSCLSVDAMAQIQSVAMTNSDDEVSLLNNGSVPAKDYQGPEFFELAQDLQSAFQQFLETDVGINQDVSSFIAMYADYKEQEHYIRFLERSKRLLS